MSNLGQKSGERKTAEQWEIKDNSLIPDRLRRFLGVDRLRVRIQNKDWDLRKLVPIVHQKFNKSNGF